MAYLSTDPLAGTSSGGGLVSRISQLLAQQGSISAQDLLAVAAAQAKAQQLNGQLAAQAQQQQGQIWGTSLKSLGQLPTRLAQQVQEYQKLFAPPPVSPQAFTPYGPSWVVGPAAPQGLVPTYDPTIDPTFASTLI